MSTDFNCIPLNCVTPSFKNQDVFTSSGLFPLDESDGCFVGVMNSVLSPAERDTYLSQANNVKRITGRSGFGMKPRAEVCYTVSGEPYKYSGKSHFTTAFPEHVKTLIPVFLEKFQTLLDSSATSIKNPYISTSNGVDIIYSSAFPRGGSISAHKDNEDKWGLVLIYSLGQTRWLRVRSDQSKAFYNVRLVDNSLVAMFGENFQRDFIHQVDKLNTSEPVGVRLSLNVRFKS